MTTFSFKGFDHAGRTRTGLVEALDLKDARRRLAAQGTSPEILEAVGEKALRKRGAKRALRKLETRALIYRELAALLRAGFPLAPALDLVTQTPDLAHAGWVLAAVRDRVREGGGLAKALAADAGGISSFEEAVIETGEKTGALEKVLERLASFMETQVGLRDRAQTAMLYPMIVALLALVVAAVVLGFMLPAVGRLLLESRVALPFLTKVMLGWGRWGGILVLLLVLGGGAWLAWLRHAWQQQPATRQKLDQWLFRLPLWGRGYRELASIRFARTLALLLEGGVDLVGAVALAGKSTGSPWLCDLAEQGAQQLRHGTKLSEALRDMGPLAESLRGWVQAGESSGQLNSLLENAANRLQQSWDRLVSRALTVLEVVLTLGIGLFVFLISLSVLLPVLQMNKTLIQP